MNIEQGAVAKLVMEKGSLVSEAELRDHILNYYIEDPDDIFAFNRMDYQGYISFEREGAHFNIYAERDIDLAEHAQNLDNILKRAGWTEYDLFAVNEHVANEITRNIGMDLRDINVGNDACNVSGSRSVSVDHLDDASIDLQPSTDRIAFSEVDLHASDLADQADSSLRGGSEALDTDTDTIGANSDLLEAQARVEELEMEVQTVRAENNRITADLGVANETIRQLRGASKTTSAATFPSASRPVPEQPASPLHAVVESHLAKLIDFDASCASEGASLIQELRSAGYVLQVRLSEPAA